MNLLTRMKSPTSSVGRIEDEGILKGSARNDRSRKTTSRTGKNDFEYSTQTGSAAPGARLAAKYRRSTSQMTPVKAVNRNRIRAKFIECRKRTKGRTNCGRYGDHRRGIVARGKSRVRVDLLEALRQSSGAWGKSRVRDDFRALPTSVGRAASRKPSRTLLLPTYFWSPTCRMA